MRRTLVSYPTRGVQQIAPLLNAHRPQFRGETLFNNLESDGIQGVILFAGNPILQWRVPVWLVLCGGLRGSGRPQVWYLEKLCGRLLCLSEGGTGNPISGRLREILAKELHLIY